MSSNKVRLSFDIKQTADEESDDFDVDTESEYGFLSSAAQKFLSYPAPNSLKLRPTSWLDGLRGTAALGVYLFHVMVIWRNILTAWHSDEQANSALQLPFIRTFFVCGGAAVSVFFVVSGYVLTYKSLSLMRSGRRDEIYPAVASSAFRRGFRLYIPPVALTFVELLSTQFGLQPPLNFGFQPEPTFFGQFIHWVGETNRFVNPYYTLKNAIRGIIIHPQYDAVIWTIPLELYGSFICYALVLLVNSVPGNGPRMAFVAIFSIITLMFASWNLCCFSAGMLLADFNLSQDESSTSLTPLPKTPEHQRLWLTVFFVSFYVAGFPTFMTSDAATKPMPGFEILRSLIPDLGLEDPARFLWTLSGIGLVLSISQVPALKNIFESNFCQHVGKISFSLYLVHEFCLVLFGFIGRTFLLTLTGAQFQTSGVVYWTVCVVWFAWFTCMVFAISALVERWVDAPSVRFAKWAEGKCARFLSGALGL